jgi:hypothetical protein
VVKLKSSFRHHVLVNCYWISVRNYHGYTCTMYTVCHNHNLVLSSFLTSHRFCSKSITTDATCGAGTVYPSSFIEIHVARSLVVCCALWVIVCSLSFYFRPLYCLTFFDLRLLINYPILHQSFLHFFWAADIIGI